MFKNVRPVARQVFYGPIFSQIFENSHELKIDSMNFPDMLWYKNKIETTQMHAKSLIATNVFAFEKRNRVQFNGEKNRVFMRFS